MVRIHSPRPFLIRGLRPRTPYTLSRAPASPARSVRVGSLALALPLAPLFTSSWLVHALARPSILVRPPNLSGEAPGSPPRLGAVARPPRSVEGDDTAADGLRTALTAGATLELIALMPTLALPALSLVAWRQGFWNRWRRVYYTALGVGVVLAMPLLYYYRLIGYHF